MSIMSIFTKTVFITEISAKTHTDGVSYTVFCFGYYTIILINLWAVMAKVVDVNPAKKNPSTIKSKDIVNIVIFIKYFYYEVTKKYRIFRLFITINF